MRRAHTIWTLKSPITCLFTSHLSYFYLTVLNEMAIASVGWNFFFWSFSFCTPKVFRHTNRPLGIVIILSLPTAVPQKNTVLSSHTHWSRLLQLSFTTICLPLNPCSCQALNSIFCQRNFFHSLDFQENCRTTWTFPQSSVLFVSILSGSSFQVHVSPANPLALRTVCL